MAGGIEHIEERHLFVNDALLAVRICARRKREVLALRARRVESASTGAHWRKALKSCRERGKGKDTFNGRVVLVDEMRLDELNGQAGLSHTTTANDHQLVFP